MRRALALVLAALSATVLSGCAGAEGERAAELLARSAQAMDRVESMSFSGRVWTDGGEGVPFALDVEGGLYAKGKRAGDMFAEATVEGVPEAAFSIVVRDGSTFVRQGAGPWTRMPAAAQGALGSAGGAGDPFGGFDLSPYVRDVSVREGQELRGARVTKLAGVLDTRALAEGMVAEMGNLAGAPSASLPRPSGDLGDVRVALWISEKTHRMKALLVDVAAKKADGPTTQVHLALVFRRFNKPVAIPEAA